MMRTTTMSALLTVSLGLSACGSGGTTRPPGDDDGIDGGGDDGGGLADGGDHLDAGPPDAGPSIDADPSAPAAVIATAPADGATDVSPQVQVRARFSRDMDPSTIDESTFLVTVNGARVAGTVTYDSAERLATFRANPGFALLGACTATISTDVADVDGGPLAAPATWSFTVRDGVWGTATLLGGPGTFAPVADVAFDGGGTAFVIWRAESSVFVDRHVPGDGWAGETVLGTGSMWPVIAAAADGRAIALWESGDPRDLMARVYTPGEGWAAATKVDVDDTYAHHVGSLFDVVFDADGNAIVVWDQQGDQARAIWARRLTAGDVWGDPVRLDAGVNPTIERGPDGSALAAWMSDGEIRAAWFRPGPGWGAVTAIGLGSRVRLGVDGAGDAIAVWHRDDGGRFDIYGSRYTTTTGWAPMTLLDSHDQNALDPDVAMHDDGTAIAVWWQAGAGGVIARDFAPTTGWAAPVELASVGAAFEPAIAIDRGGHALAVWAQGDSRTIHASRRRAGGDWRTPVAIDAGDPGSSFFPTIAVDRTGRGVAAWTRSIGPAQSGSEYRVWANLFQ